MDTQTCMYNIHLTKSILFWSLQFSGSRYVLNGDLKTWHEANQTCIEIGARLMEIRTQEEYETALQFEEELRSFWLGGSDLQGEGNWVWDSNDEEINLNVFWESGSPFEFKELNYNCIAMQSDGMEDLRCSRTRPTVCEYN